LKESCLVVIDRDAPIFRARSRALAPTPMVAVRELSTILGDIIRRGRCPEIAVEYDCGHHGPAEAHIAPFLQDKKEARVAARHLRLCCKQGKLSQGEQSTFRIEVPGGQCPECGSGTRTALWCGGVVMDLATACEVPENPIPVGIGAKQFLQWVSQAADGDETQRIQLTSGVALSWYNFFTSPTSFGPALIALVFWMLGCVIYAFFAAPQIPMISPEIFYQQVQEQIENIPVPRESPHYAHYRQYYLQQYQQHLKSYREVEAEWAVRQAPLFNWNALLTGAGFGVWVFAAVLAFSEYRYGTITVWMEVVEDWWTEWRNRPRSPPKDPLADDTARESLLNELGERKREAVAAAAAKAPTAPVAGTEAGATTASEAPGTAGATAAAQKSAPSVVTAAPARSGGSARQRRQDSQREKLQQKLAERQRQQQQFQHKQQQEDQVLVVDQASEALELDDAEELETELAPPKRRNKGGKAARKHAKAHQVRAVESEAVTQEEACGEEDAEDEEQDTTVGQEVNEEEDGGTHEEEQDADENDGVEDAQPEEDEEDEEEDEEGEAEVEEEEIEDVEAEEPDENVEVEEQAEVDEEDQPGQEDGSAGSDRESDGAFPGGSDATTTTEVGDTSQDHSDTQQSLSGSAGDAAEELGADVCDRDAAAADEAWEVVPTRAAGRAARRAQASAVTTTDAAPALAATAVSASAPSRSCALRPAVNPAPDCYDPLNPAPEPTATTAAVPSRAAPKASDAEVPEDLEALSTEQLVGLLQKDRMRHRLARQGVQVRDELLGWFRGLHDDRLAAGAGSWDPLGATKSAGSSCRAESSDAPTSAALKAENASLKAELKAQKAAPRGWTVCTAPGAFPYGASGSSAAAKASAGPLAGGAKIARAAMPVVPPAAGCWDPCGLSDQPPATGSRGSTGEAAKPGQWPVLSKAMRRAGRRRGRHSANKESAWWAAAGGQMRAEAPEFVPNYDGAMLVPYMMDADGQVIAMDGMECAEGMEDMYTMQGPLPETFAAPAGHVLVLMGGQAGSTGCYPVLMPCGEAPMVMVAYTGCEEQGVPDGQFDVAPAEIEATEQPDASEVPLIEDGVRTPDLSE